MHDASNSVGTLNASPGPIVRSGMGGLRSLGDGGRTDAPRRRAAVGEAPRPVIPQRLATLGPARHGVRQVRAERGVARERGAGGIAALLGALPLRQALRFALLRGALLLPLLDLGQDRRDAVV